MKHIIYKTTNTVNGKIYIGKHSTIDVDDFYLGSGTALKAAIAKYGAQCFTKEVLFEFDTEEEAFLMESTIVTPEFVRRKDTYNLVVGGSGNTRYGYYDPVSDIHYEHAMQCPAIKEKAKNTNRERYGVDYTLQNESIRQKGVETMKWRYGVSSTLELEENRAKCAEALQSKYGTVVPLKNQTIKQKYQHTMYQRHGATVPLQNYEIKQKYDETIANKYGVKHIMEVEEIRERSKLEREKTMLERYGTKTYQPTIEEIEALKERNRKNNSSIHGGTFWANDGVKNKKFKKSDTLPRGYVKGKLSSSIDKQSQAARNRPKKDCPCCLRPIDSSNFDRHVVKCSRIRHTSFPLIQADEAIPEKKHILEGDKIQPTTDEKRD